MLRCTVTRPFGRLARLTQSIPSPAHVWTRWSASCLQAAGPPCNDILDTAGGPSRQFSSSTSSCAVHKTKPSLRYSYSLLEVSEDAEVAEIREAYINCAKKYHPDSGAPTADATKFSAVKEAYKTILAQQQEQEEDEEGLEDVVSHDTEKIIFDIKHTAPQHRQYLTFDGVGTGTPMERMRIFQKYRVAKAADSVHDYRVQHKANEEEGAIMVQAKQEAKKAKISNAIERLVEDMIQDSMNRGDFDNLPGKGKPLSNANHNPLVDITTHNINRILAENGYAPEWIMLQSEIRKGIKESRKKLAVLRSKMGSPPFSSETTTKWQSQVSKYRSAVAEINEDIEKFNMVVPFLNKQMVFFQAEKDIKKIYENWEKYLPDNPEDTDVIYNAHFGSHQQQMTYNISHEKVNWIEVWTDIKHVFKS